MTLSKTWQWILRGGICAMILVAGCTSDKKTKWLNFFFDGVPGSQNEAIAKHAEYRKAEKIDLPPIWVDPPPINVPADPQQWVVHKPYAERRCIECHASNYSQSLKGDVSAMCAACHKGFLVKTKFIHAPVSDGQCTLCHLPHQGKERFLLAKPVRELCFDCHKAEYVLKIAACSETPGRICTECHDPHMEDRKFRLLPPGHTSPVRKMTPEK